MRILSSASQLLAILCVSAVVNAATTPQYQEVGYGGGCAFECNGHGTCTDLVKGHCTCFEGWVGFDCSGRACPAGTAWADRATADNTAHVRLAECSAAGDCDRTTGLCACRAGVTGSACNRQMCPGAGAAGACNGHGRCVSLAQAGPQIDYRTLTVTGVTTYAGWDADMIHGCACDAGYEGYDCSLRSCPKGTEPMSIGTSAPCKGVFKCSCDSASTVPCQLAITVNGETTVPLPYDAPAELVQLRLSRLSTVTAAVTVAYEASQTTLCAPADVAADVTITLSQAAASLPQLHFAVSAGNGTYTVNAAATTFGTRAPVECSGRGLCDYARGECTCFAGFGPSNGAGGSGAIADCGYRDLAVALSACPTSFGMWNNSASAMCSGQASSCSASMQCVCKTGYTGAACERMACTGGTPWFQETSGLGTHVGSAPCHARGVCDYSTGKCACSAAWARGDACEAPYCDSDCSKHGQCVSMSAMAATSNTTQGDPALYTYATPAFWDADVWGGCRCNRTTAVDGYFSWTTDTFRGVPAHADTDWIGHACARARCPRGDDPATDGANEVQTVTCRATGGSFFLTFRGNSSAEIAWDAPAATYATAIEAMSMIGRVSVTYPAGQAAACGAAAPGNAAAVEFLTEHGDVPMLGTVSRLTLAVTPSATPALSVAETTKGTTEELECAGRGACDASTGRCACFPGYQSSDGMGGPGARGDCGYRNPQATALFAGAAGARTGARASVNHF